MTNQQIKECALLNFDGLVLSAQQLHDVQTRASENLNDDLIDSINSAIEFILDTQCSEIDSKKIESFYKF